MLSGAAEVIVADERARVPAGGLVVVPKYVPHEVRNIGEEPLRFAAVYAEPQVVTEYEREVQPDGSAARQTVS